MSDERGFFRKDERCKCRVLTHRTNQSKHGGGGIEMCSFCAEENRKGFITYCETPERDGSDPNG